jgi:Nif-specific regulatory protein
MANNKIGSDRYTPEQKVKDYEQVIAILQSIGSTLQVDEILKRILQETLALCGADQGSIVLLQQESTEEPMTLIRHGKMQESLIDHYLNTLICGWIIENGKLLHTNDLSATFGKQQMKSKFNDISSLIGIPLINGNEIIGVLSVIFLNRNSLFNAREIHLLQLISTSCAQFIVNARLHESYYNEARRLRHEIEDKFSLHGIIGRSPKMQQVFSFLERIMDTEARVLLEGESGTGKELIARVLHYESPRKDKPFVAVDCGAIPHNLFESELFGYVRGAFTGAERDRKGIIEEAHEGTLFLDEITNMPVDIQSKFLRAVQEGEFRPVGSNRIAKVDVRIIAAASVDLRSFIKEGKFREDLYYRLNVINIVLPPLRDRKEDIPVLANHFLTAHSKRYGKNVKVIEPVIIELFELYDWPGNVREMENVLERMIVLAANDSEYLPTELLPLEIRYHDASSDIPSKVYESVKTTHLQDERKIILDTLVQNGWNQSAAARQLGMSEGTLRYKLKKLKLK